MKKKIKMFGIVTSVLLILLSLSPAVTSTDPSALTNEVNVFLSAHESELQELDAFFASWEADQEIPAYISQIMNELITHLRLIVDPYIEDPDPEEWKGWNSFWRSTNHVTGLNDEHPWMSYTGKCWSIDQFVTFSIIDGIDQFGWSAIDIVLFVLSIFPSEIEEWLQAVFGALLGLLWTFFSDWLEQIKDNNPYGIVFFLFIEVDIIRLRFQELHFKPQLDHEWYPSEYWQDPEDYPRNEFIWDRIF